MIQSVLKWFFFLQCLLLLLLAYVTEGFEGGADAVCHWMISRDAPMDPMLFLDQWNKPIFTILSAPFAQFGLLGMRIFSALTGILTGVVLYHTSKKYLGELAWLPAIILLFIPQYLSLLTSSMTEPLFGLFLSLFILFVSKNNIGWAALVAGLSPFVRQEGIALIPIAAVVSIYVGQIKKLPILFVGTTLFALIGWSVSGDILWILTSFPYSSSAADIYGSGELFHFLSYYKVLFGIPIAALFLIGTGFLLWVVLIKLKNRNHLSPYELALLAGLAFSVFFFTAHSYVWWKGLSGSAGLIRVMACFAPAMALVSAYGVFALLRIPLLRDPIVKSVLLSVFLSASAFQVYSVVELPTPVAQTQIVIEEAANWLVSQHAKERVHYADPVFSHFAVGRLDIESPINKGPLYPSQITDLSTGEYIVWDAHFSPNEARLPLDSLLFHPYLIKRKSFHPQYSFLAQGQPYVVHIFQKTATPAKKELKNVVLMVDDFESESSEFERIKAVGRNNSTCTPSGKEHEFVTIRKKLTAEELENSLDLSVEVWIHSEKPLGNQEFFLVSDADLNKGERHYLSTSSNQLSSFKPNEWNRMSQRFELAQNLPVSFELKCYIWNPGGIELLVDDFRLEIKLLQPSTEKK